MDEHKRSKKHKKCEKEYLKKHPEADASSVFKSISHEVSQDFMSEVNRSLNKAPLKVEEDSELSKSSIPSKTTLESLRICLFCNKESDGVKKNLDHMRMKHNFTILDIECLINLKGLLAYIAERIQLGKMCLCCGKQFQTAERAQQHMRDVGHCMMPYEGTEEFEAFYDFSRLYRDLPQKTLAITSKAEDSKTASKKEK